MSQLVIVGSNATEDVFRLVERYDKSLLIEPGRDAFERLANRYSNDSDVTVLNLACGDYEGCADFYAYNHGFSSSLGIVTDQARQLYHEHDLTETATVEVRVRRLPDILSSLDIQYIHYLLIDAQGMDVPILLTMRDWLQDRRIGTLTIEVNAAGFVHYENLPNREADAMQFMSKLPYRLESRSGCDWQPDLTFRLRMED